ncbi:ABC transporter substrate-binding protein [uncultured Jatrophihabitans sp.]|uniref:ABC transporter substrate-binding protein n=1 Tax=uncultured Jatrophihabitans sp. TaxID=1610747 RepID=UPI0035CC2542
MARQLDPILNADLSRRTLLKGAAGAGALATLPALLAACSSSGSTSSGSVTGKTSIGSNYSDAAPKAAFAAALAAYSRHSNVAVNTTDHNSFQNNIQNYLQGSPNDVFTWFSGNRQRYFAKQGLLEPIDDVWEKIGSRFTDPVKKASKGDDGKYYLVPWVNYPWAMFYKKSVFAKHGYQVPADWDALVSLCKQMQSDGFSNPIAIGQKDGWPAMGTFDIINMRMNGYQFHVDLMSHKESWTDPKVKAVFTQWSELAPYYTPGSTGRTFQEAIQLFDANKTSPMIFHGTDQVVPQVQKANLSDVSFFPFPQIKSEFPTNSAIDAPIDGFLMSKKVKNRKGAAALMEYLGTGAAEHTFLAPNPADVGVATDFPSNSYTALQKQAVDLIKNTKNLAQFLDRDTQPDFAYPIVQNALNDFLNDPKSSSSVCSKLESQAKGVFH